jgi:hypothetical protein
VHLNCSVDRSFIHFIHPSIHSVKVMIHLLLLDNKRIFIRCEHKVNPSIHVSSGRIIDGFPQVRKQVGCHIGVRQRTRRRHRRVREAESRPEL